jgi:hypothetical protein
MASSRRRGAKGTKGREECTAVPRARVAGIPQEKRDPPGPVARPLAGGITGERIAPHRSVHAILAGGTSITDRTVQTSAEFARTGRCAIGTSDPCCARLGELSAA